MEHTEAVNIGATERYLLGELSDDEGAAFEEHFFSCPDCAADVRAAAAVVEGAEVLLRDEPSAAPAAPRARVLRGPASWFWPMPLGAAAALLLACGGLAWQGLVVLPDARRAAEEAWPTHDVFLTVSRSERTAIVLAHGEALALRLSRSSDVSYPCYGLRLTRNRDARVVRAWQQAPPADGELTATIRGLEDGAYTLAVDGLASEGGPVRQADVARYEFSLRYRKAVSADPSSLEAPPSGPGVPPQ